MGRRRPNSHDVRRQRHRLWKNQKKRCYWCDKPTVLPEVLLREFVPLDDFYEHDMVEHINDIIEQLKAKNEKFRIRWNSQLATVDHVVEFAEGGSHTDDNIVIACLPCNQERGRMYSESLDSSRIES